MNYVQMNKNGKKIYQLNDITILVTMIQNVLSLGEINAHLTCFWVWGIWGWRWRWGWRWITVWRGGAGFRQAWCASSNHINTFIFLCKEEVYIEECWKIKQLKHLPFTGLYIYGNKCGVHHTWNSVFLSKFYSLNYGCQLESTPATNVS